MLQGINLAGADLSKCDLSRHELIGANLTGANLAGEAHVFQNSSLDGEEVYVDFLVSSQSHADDQIPSPITATESKATNSAKHRIPEVRAIVPSMYSHR